MIPSRARMALLAALLGTSAAARAGQIEVAPVTFDLPAGVTSTTLTVTNHGDGRTGIQLRGFRWSQTPTEDPLVPTRDLLFSPPIFELAPGESQTVRLMLRQPPGDREGDYRLLVDELPAAGGPSQVQLALRLSLPLFAAPSARTWPELRWRLVAGPHGPELAVTNRGGRRDRVTDLAVAAGGAPVPASPLANAWVLPGAERRWALPGLRAGGAARLTGRSEAGAIDVPVAPVDAP